MNRYHIMVVLINHRTKAAVAVQDVLTNHGCNIKVRLGLHETESVCADEGLVVLQLGNDEADISVLKKALNDIEGVEAKVLSLGN